MEERDIYIQVSDVVPLCCSLIERHFYFSGKSLDLNGEDDTTTWTDPSSGRVYTVDRRTGNSYLKDQEVRGCIARRRILDVPWLKGNHEPCIHNHSKGEMPNWMKEALQVCPDFAASAF